MLVLSRAVNRQSPAIGCGRLKSRLGRLTFGLEDTLGETKLVCGTELSPDARFGWASHKANVTPATTGKMKILFLIAVIEPLKKYTWVGSNSSSHDLLSRRGQRIQPGSFSAAIVGAEMAGRNKKHLGCLTPHVPYKSTELRLTLCWQQFDFQFPSQDTRRFAQCVQCDGGIRAIQ